MTKYCDCSIFSFFFFLSFILLVVKRAGYFVVRDQNVDDVFPIANNRDYSAFRTLIYVPLCRLHFGSDCNELFSAFLAMLEKFVKFLFPEQFQLVECFFSLAHHAVHILTITRLKI